MNPLVTLENLGKTYRSGTVALEGIGLALHDGEFLSLLGPSGCGKSTLLRILAGLAEPSSGRIERTGPVAAKGGIGFVFQEPTLMPWATVAENIHLPLRLAGIRRRAAEPAIARALAAVGLEGFADAYPRELSGGMRMRVSIARAYVTRPRLLLLDEPFAALDEITRLKLAEDLLTLRRQEDWTVVFVTHSVFESVFLADRIALFSPRPGRIVEEIAIGLPSPRGADLRMTAEYGACCRHVSARLAEAMR